VPVEELKQKYRVEGAPTVVLIDSAGNVRYDLAVTDGSIAAEEFLRRLREVK
jgi:thioredoxin-related protein